MISSYENCCRRAEERVGVLAKERDTYLGEARRQRAGWEAAQKENADLSEQLKVVIEHRDHLEAEAQVAQKAYEELKVAHFKLRDEFTCYLNDAKARRASELMYNQVVGSLRCANLFWNGEVTEADLETIRLDEKKYREELVNAPVAILPESFRVPIFESPDVEAPSSEVEEEDSLSGDAAGRALNEEEGHEADISTETAPLSPIKEGGERSSQSSDPTSSSSSEG